MGSFAQIECHSGENLQMDRSINPGRIRKALSALKEAGKELQAALDEAEAPRPDHLPPPAKVAKRRKSLRRVL
jgi:hypothetical protein